MKGKVFLSSTECRLYADLVVSLKPFWFDRGGFYTLGASAYLDSPTLYPAVANLANKVLAPAFGTLYSRLFDHLGIVQGRPTTTVAGTALPGFHIFTDATNGVQAEYHTDEPYTRVAWGQKVTDSFTFTILLEAPKCGAGIEFGGHLKPYQLGWLYTHSGSVPHRIANTGDLEAGEHRITLQGHGVTLENGLVNLYF